MVSKYQNRTVLVFLNLFLCLLCTEIMTSRCTVETLLVNILFTRNSDVHCYLQFVLVRIYPLYLVLSY